MNGLVKHTILIVLLAGLSTSIYAQKKPIDHTVYDDWKSIEDEGISDNGRIVVYRIEPQEGDGMLYIKDLKQNDLDSVPRGDRLQSGANAAWLAFDINPQFDTLRQLRLDGVKEKDLPDDSLGIFLPDNDSLIKIPNIYSFDASEEGRWIAYKLTTEEEEEEERKGWWIFRKKDKSPTIKSKGKTMVIYDPLTGKEHRHNRVTSYRVNEESGGVAWVEEFEVDTTDSVYVKVFDPSTEGVRTIYAGVISVENLTFDEPGEQLAFLTSQDTSENKMFELRHWTKGQSNATVIVDSTTKLRNNWVPNEHGYLWFSDSGQRLYFGVNERPEQPEEDTLLDSEKPEVDIWSWHDKRLQPQQLLSKRRDERKTYTTVYHFSTGKAVVLEDEEMETVRMEADGNGDFGLGRSSELYQHTYSWSMPWRQDIYLVDIRTGERTLLLEGHGYSVELSPDGKYLAWYAGEDSVWMGMKISDGDPIPLTEEIGETFTRDNNGSPYIPGDHGNAGWTKDGKFIAYAEHGIWMLDPTGKEKPVSIDGNSGNKTQTRYRLMKLDREKTYVDLSERNYLHAFNDLSKKAGWYLLDKDMATPRPLMMDEHAYSSFEKAKNADVFLWKRYNFKEPKNLWLATTPNLSDARQITDANPQQKDYLWGDVRLVEWTSYNGHKLEGLLYTPENLDTNAIAEYPMIVYFYEEYSDRIHFHYPPRPTASIVYPTEYVSNGYIVFIPDIRYKPGHPGMSAYDCIMSGTDSILARYPFIDSTRMGLQGQSWGGYQTAYLVTQTDRYAAAMAGAPVSNMTSAYGGMRWGSGLSRMFQYECTQSRIGGTLWDSLDLYIENSPVFFAPEVETPLLIMHNDGDGAVPWYQGIEYFVALRRLGKKVWMLNYNDDAHNLRKRANKKDLSIRMRQFFDHYLQGEPIPEWMEKGVPATQKGVDYGYELLEE